MVESKIQAPAYGLTGGIGCGKSTASRLLAERGWEVIDTDQIARQCLAPGEEGYKYVVDAFGPSILNKEQSIDRSALGRIVFSDECSRKRLNSILHPIIRAQWHFRLQQHRLHRPGLPAVVDIPLLFETGAEGAFDRTVCVGCSPAVQQERLAARGWEGEEIRRRIHAQWPLAEKIKHSDLVVWNDGSLELLRQQLERLAAGG